MSTEFAFTLVSARLEPVEYALASLTTEFAAVRQVATDPSAKYYGLVLNDQSLTPGANPRLGPTRFDDWLKKN